MAKFSFFLFSFILITLSKLITSEDKINYLKAAECLKRSVVLNKLGKILYNDYNNNISNSVNSIYNNFGYVKKAINKCISKAKNSFDFDPNCSLKCLANFLKEYDYSCFGTCYY